MYVFVPNSFYGTCGQTATRLLRMTEEAGLSRKAVKAVYGGFNVPEAVLKGVEPEAAVEAPASAEPTPEAAEPVAEEKPPVAYSDVRAWAAENGVEVSEKGRIAQSVIDQYLEANKE